MFAKRHNKAIVQQDVTLNHLYIRAKHELGFARIIY